MKKILLHQTLFPLVVLAMTLDLSNVSMTHQVSCCENQSHLTVSFEMNEVEPRLCEVPFKHSFKILNSEHVYSIAL